MDEITVKFDDLEPFVRSEGRKLRKHLWEASAELGARYNTRNEWELMFSKFGDPRYNTEIYLREWALILDKKSELPASIRYCVAKFMQAVFYSYLESRKANDKSDDRE